MRFAIDTGGTFTDLVVEGKDELRLYKAATTPEDPVKGVLDVLALAASDYGAQLGDFLAEGNLLVYGTTIATNAVLTGKTAKTALLVTAGHPDVLLFREGGRIGPFDHAKTYEDPYIPRADTYEIQERIGSQGEVVRPLDETTTVQMMERLEDGNFEAVAVCLLWSIINPVHERRVGELLKTHLPKIPFTLSHELNPTIREYRRASSTAIDASLKPLMSTHLQSLEEQLRRAGFEGRVLVVASNGGVLDAKDVAEAPIHSIQSGPAMAPVAGSYYANKDAAAETAVVADTGGTSFDVSLLRRGRIPFTRETWLGREFTGHITAFPSVDVKSIGAGGGSIAWVDAGGLLQVGPQSAGAAPGPVAYGRGGTEPTVTDACVVLGYIDPDFFLGGSMHLQVAAAREAIESRVAAPLGLSVEEAAAAVYAIATERMVQAIEAITVDRGVDPREGVLVGGGGAAGLNALAIARRLGSQAVVIPEVGATLSAAGALMSDLVAEFPSPFISNSKDFGFQAANKVLAELEQKGRYFAEETGLGDKASIEFFVEARFAHQVWELEVPLRVMRFHTDDEASQMFEDFRQLHEELYAVRDDETPIEVLNLRARTRCRMRESFNGAVVHGDAESRDESGARKVYFSNEGWVEAKVLRLEAMSDGAGIHGPAIIESPFTTVVVEVGASAKCLPSGSLLLATKAKSA